MLDSAKVRRELFKLHYGYEVFDLNVKADAFEAFDFLLTVLHSWVKYDSNSSTGEDHDNDVAIVT